MQVDFFCHHMFYSKVNISIITGFQKVRKVETTGIYPLDKDNMPWQIDSLDIQNDVAVDLFEQNQNSSSEILISTPRFSTTNKKQTENPIKRILIFFIFFLFLLLIIKILSSPF